MNKPVKIGMSNNAGAIQLLVLIVVTQGRYIALTEVLSVGKNFAQRSLLLSAEQYLKIQKSVCVFGLALCI